jgi:hypothetical protein
LTILANRSDRLALGIDSFERGLIYSALLLRFANTSGDKSNPYYNAVRISQNPLNGGTLAWNPIILIEAKLPYSSSALNAGVDLIGNLLTFGNLDPNPFSASCQASLSPVPIPVDPEHVNTLERYFFWCAVNLQCGFLSTNPMDLSVISIQFFEEDPREPSVVIKANLPYNHKKWICNSNLVEAVKNSIFASCTQAYVAVDSVIDNNFMVGNLASVSN